MKILSLIVFCCICYNQSVDLYFLLFLTWVLCIAAILKHPRAPTTTNPAIEYPSVDSDHISKRTRPIGISDEVCWTAFGLSLSF